MTINSLRSKNEQEKVCSYQDSNLGPKASKVSFYDDLCVLSEDFETKQSPVNETFFKVNFAKISL